MNLLTPPSYFFITTAAATDRMGMGWKEEKSAVSAHWLQDSSSVTSIAFPGCNGALRGPHPRAGKISGKASYTTEQISYSFFHFFPPLLSPRSASHYPSRDSEYVLSNSRLAMWTELDLLLRLRQIGLCSWRDVVYSRTFGLNKRLHGGRREKSSSFAKYRECNVGEELFEEIWSIEVSNPQQASQIKETKSVK